MKITVIHSPTESEPFIVINKPGSLPSAPLKDGEESALTQAIQIFPQIKNVTGKKAIEYGLVHRIDTETKGLILIAATQDFYNYIQKEQSENRFIKHYKAKIEKNDFQKLDGFPEFNQDLESVTSSFRPFGPKGKEVRPVTENSGRAAEKKSGSKQYSTSIQINGNEAFCTITNGYRHQVRCHLSWAGFPVKGDRIYNASYRDTDSEMMFEACGIEFKYCNKTYNFSL